MRVPLRWVRHASVVAVVVVLLAVTACDDDDSSGDGTPVPPTATDIATGTTTPTATPSPTPTVTPTAPVPPEIEDFRAFAAEIDAALAEGDRGFFEQRTVGDTLGLTTWRSDVGGDAPAAEVLSLIESLWATEVESASDEFGTAGVQVFAIGTTNIPETLAAVVTALIERPQDPRLTGEGPLRAVLVSQWSDEDGEWRLTGVMDAFVLGEDFLEVDGVGRGWMRTWERFES